MPPLPFGLGAYKSRLVWSNSCKAWCAGLSMQARVFKWWCMDSFNRRSSKGASLASVYRLDTGLVQNAPNASLNPELWMLSSCRASPGVEMTRSIDDFRLFPCWAWDFKSAWIRHSEYRYCVYYWILQWLHPVCQHHVCPTNYCGHWSHWWGVFDIWPYWSDMTKLQWWGGCGMKFKHNNDTDRSIPQGTLGWDSLDMSQFRAARGKVLYWCQWKLPYMAAVQVGWIDFQMQG